MDIPLLILSICKYDIRPLLVIYLTISSYKKPPDVVIHRALLSVLTIISPV